MESKRRGGWLAVTGITVLTLPILYVVAYFGLVEVAYDLPAYEHPTVVDPLAPGWPIEYFQPKYRISDSVSRRLFDPIQRLDQIVRRSKWRASEDLPHSN